MRAGNSVQNRCDFFMAELLEKFMRKGKIRMKKLFLSFIILVVLNVGSPAQEWKWKTFSPSDGAWSILAPGAMKPDAEAQQPNSKKGSYSFTDFSGFFAVIYRDSPTRLVPWKPDYSSYYRKVRKQIVKAAKGELMKETEINYGDGKGREVYVKIPVGTIAGPEGQPKTKYRVERFRMFFVGKRFYLLLAVLPENEVDTPQVNNYFNSFVAK